MHVLHRAVEGKSFQYFLACLCRVGIEEPLDCVVVEPERAKLLEAQPLQRYDEPSQVASRVCKVVLVQVYDHRPRPVEYHVGRDVASMPRTGFEIQSLPCRLLELPKQGLALCVETTSQSFDLQRPVPGEDEQLLRPVERPRARGESVKFR